MRRWSCPPALRPPCALGPRALTSWRLTARPAPPLGTYSSADVLAGQATGGGSVLSWPGGGSVSFSTSADDTPAVQADTGGSVILNVTAPYAGTVTTTGEGSIGLYATGSGSTEEGTVASSISVTNFTISTQNLGDYSIPIYASQGGQITVTGGSATSVGDSSFGAAVVGGGTINLTGTTILTTGDGSAGMIINGAGGVINASGVSITTHGNVDSSLGNDADGAYNGPFGATYPAGGTLTITSSTITTTEPTPRAWSRARAGRQRSPAGRSRPVAQARTRSLRA